MCCSVQSLNPCVDGIWRFWYHHIEKLSAYRSIGIILVSAAVALQLLKVALESCFFVHKIKLSVRSEIDYGIIRILLKMLA